ncbi:MAG: HD domain-containing protein [Anaerolineales bacterium]|jgi:hypothetical protein
MIYRFRQFARAYTDAPDPQALSRAEQFLSPDLFALFSQMLLFEQAHSLRVFEGIRETDYTQADLLTAALLHDVGKARAPLRPWQRAIAVLLKKFMPAAYQRIGEAASLKAWNAGVVVAAQHARWGAEMAAQAGASTLAVKLILHHQDEDISGFSETFQTFLRLLKQVDEKN